VVVTHNSEAVIGRCLDSLAGLAPVIVVDNASSDASVAESQRRPWARVIANARNRGFGAAVNQAASMLDADCILILNPDVQLIGGLDRLAAACMEHGVAAGVLEDETGKPQRGFSVRRLPTAPMLALEALGVNRAWAGNPINRRYRCLDHSLDIAGPVEQAAGAFLMIRRDVFQRLGGFDESFWPVWFEDVDLAQRARRIGYPIWFVPDARARHIGAHSVSRLAGKWRVLYWYVSLLRYAAKHYSPAHFRAVCAAVIAGACIRVFAGAVTGSRWGKLTHYRPVLALAAAGVWSGRAPFRVISNEEWRNPEGNEREQVLTHSTQR
jgi:N-acetylglucosaminyl-diphospho-decaprenol L-rhamnosyltransferase